jgi:hypothetical protein
MPIKGSLLRTLGTLAFGLGAHSLGAAQPLSNHTVPAETTFDVVVGPSGATEVAVLSGSLEFCDANGKCVVLANGCELATTEGEGGAHKVNENDEFSRQVSNFPFISSQQELQKEFRADTGPCLVRATFFRPLGDEHRTY